MRRPICLALVVAAVLAVSITPAAAQPKAERIVNVYNWTDYIAPNVIEEFTKETGIKARYDTFDSNDTLETKLLAGKSGYDVVVPTAYFLERQIKAGVFQKLDKAKLPNLVNMWPEITQRLASYDPGNAYAVNYMWGTTGIGYNVKKAREALGGDGRIDSWDIVFKPENLAKFKDCGVYMLDFVRRYPAGGAALSRARSEHHEGGRSAEGGRSHDQDQALRAQVSLLRICQSAGLRRNLPGGRLFRRYQAGAKARGGSQERRRHRLRDPEGRDATVVRQSRHSARRQERGRGATRSSTICRSRRSRRRTRISSSTPTATWRARNSSTSRSSTTRRSIRTTR